MEIFIVPVLFVLIFLFSFRTKSEQQHIDFEAYLNNLGQLDYDDPSFSDNHDSPDSSDNHDSLEPMYKPQFPTDLMFITAEEKKEYLQSYAWQYLKQQRLVIAGHKCESCGSTNSLQLHHITYARLTVEDIEDVVIVCSTCHNKLHDRLGYDRTTIYPVDVLHTK